MKTKLSGVGATLLISLFWVSEAFACLPPLNCEIQSPEIDAAAGITALALMASLGALLYGRVKR